MSIPKPIFLLQGHCSVIYDNVLYVYSPEGLQSLPLHSNATWTQEPTGVSVTGGSCVLGSVDGDHSLAGLYIVGGATNSSAPDYPGLQRYSFHDKRWDTIDPLTRVTQNRQRHGAAFLNASSSILVYAGSQDGDDFPSTQTFVVDTRPPYNVRSFTSIAPPAVDPIMLSWSDDRVAMVGGSVTNDRLFTFGPEDGWVDAAVVLPRPPSNKSDAQSAMLSLDDGSKVLVSFDFSQSPNRVSRTVVLNPGGRPAAYGQTVGDGADRPKFRQRDVTLSTLPTYNESLAPTTVRQEAAIAQDPNGLTVISGGEGEDPLSIFDALENRWVGASELLGDQSQTPSGEPAATSSSAATESPTSTVAPPGRGSPPPPLMILGVVLGVVCGIAALLIIALLLLRFKKQKKVQPQSDGDFSNEKSRKRSRLSFEDQSVEPIKSDAQPMGHSIPPSTRHLPVVAGQVSHNRATRSGDSRLESPPQQSNSTSFGTSTFSPKKYPLASSQPLSHKEPAELQERPSTSGVRPSPSQNIVHPRATHRKVNSSWSTYFSGNTAVDVGDKRKTAGSTVSRTSSASRESYQPNSSVPPANLRSAKPGLTDSHGNQLEKLNVRKGSPVIGHTGQEATRQGMPVKQGIPAHISRTDSIATSTANDHGYHRPSDNDSAYPRSPPVDDYGWAFQDSSWSGPPHRLVRPPSSSYTNSVQGPVVTSPGKEDGPKSSIRPITQWLHDSMSFPAAHFSRPVTSRGRTRSPGEVEASEAGRDFFGSNHQDKLHQSDVSWLNLNGNASANRHQAPGGVD